MQLTQLKNCLLTKSLKPATRTDCRLSAKKRRFNPKMASSSSSRKGPPLKKMAAESVKEIEKEESDKFACSIVDEVMDKSKNVLGDDIPQEILDKLKSLWLKKLDAAKSEEPDVDIRKVSLFIWQP